MHVLLKCNSCFVDKIIYNPQKERCLYSKCLIVSTHKNFWDQRETWLFKPCFVPRDGVVCGTCVFAALVPTHWMTYLSLLLYRTLTLLYLRFLDCRVRECEVCDTDIPCTFLATPHDMNLRIIRLFFIFFLLSCEKAFTFCHSTKPVMTVCDVSDPHTGKLYQHFNVTCIGCSSRFWGDVRWKSYETFKSFI